MASGGDSENPMADVEAVGDIDGKSTDPSQFSPVPEDDRESFVFPFFDLWYDNGGNFPYVPSKVSPPPPDWEWMLKDKEVTADRVWFPLFPASLISKFKGAICSQCLLISSSPILPPRIGHIGWQMNFWTLTSVAS